jgi:hypothetical protein
MLAIHDRSNEEMRNRLETICIGLGLVRLLQDASRFDEAEMTLSLLEYGCERDSEPSDKKGEIRAAATTKDTAEIPLQSLFLA